MSNQDNSSIVIDLITTDTITHEDNEIWNVFSNFVTSINQDLNIRNNQILRNASSYNIIVQTTIYTTKVDEILPEPKLDKFNFDESRRDTAECAICMEPFTGECAELPCKHTYHYSCIEKWCTKKLECPLCREIIPTQE